MQVLLNRGQQNFSSPSDWTKTNREACQWYRNYFNYVLNRFIIEVKSIDNQIFYVFSEKEVDEWIDNIYKEERIIASRYLDDIQPIHLKSNSIKQVRNLTDIVREQYNEQRNAIFLSYTLVEEILSYPENPMVLKAIKLIQKSKEDDDSDRKYWRVLNEKYYGLDIHPLMEYEVKELERIKYYCENPDEIKGSMFSPVMRVSLVAAVPLGVAVGFLASK